MYCISSFALINILLQKKKKENKKNSASSMSQHWRPGKWQRRQQGPKFVPLHREPLPRATMLALPSVVSIPTCPYFSHFANAHQLQWVLLFISIVHTKDGRWCHPVLQHLIRPLLPWWQKYSSHPPLTLYSGQQHSVTYRGKDTWALYCHHYTLLRVYFISSKGTCLKSHCVCNWIHLDINFLWS